MKAIVIGPGYMGKKHLEGYISHPSVEVAGIVCKRESTRKKIESSYNIKCYTHLTKALAETKPDIASICTPVETHFKIAKKCLENSVDLLIEKPLTSSIKDAESLAKLAGRKNRVILCAHTELFNPSVQKFIRTASKLTPHSIIIKISGDLKSPKEKSLSSTKNSCYNRLYHLVYVLNCLVKGLPDSLRTSKLELGVNKQHLLSKLDINGVKILININHIPNELLKKSFTVFSENQTVEYLLESGQEYLIKGNSKTALPGSAGNMIDKMIQYFVSSSMKKDSEYYGNMENAMQTMSISKSIIRNLSDLRTENRAPSSYLQFRPSLACNQNCKFCNVKFEAGFMENSFQDIKMEICRQLPDNLSVSGGEPTILPYIQNLVQFAKEHGVRLIQFQTNAVLFSYKQFASSLAEKGLTDVLVSLHSHKKEISDYLTSTPGSWEKTNAGIKNIISAGVRVRISHVLTTKNYTDFPEFILFLKKSLPGVYGVDVLLDQHKGMGKYNKNLVPKLSLVESYIKKSVKLAKENNIELLNAFTIPLCYWPEQDSSLEFRELSEASDTKRIKSLKLNKVKAASCTKCRYDNLCFGVWKGYSEVHGLSELKPKS